MTILFYQPYNQVVVYVESVAEQFVRQGHTVLLLTHAQKGETHKRFDSFGCETFAHPIKKGNSLIYFWRRVSSLVRFCREKRVDLVYSHFQEANTIAVIAQFFSRAKYIVTRHHSDCAFLDNNKRERLADRIINSLAKTYIAPSQKVWDQIVTVEGTPAGKVQLIPYGYNFHAFPKVDMRAVEAIRKQYTGDLLLVKAARFIPEKRHRELIHAVRTMADNGLNIQLLLLGKGPLQPQIEDDVIALGLSKFVHVIGFRLDVMNYYAAADMVVHFSLSEASNSAIKEAALAGTTVAVCRDVGDFDDYIMPGENGFLLDKHDPLPELVRLVDELLTGKRYDLKRLGNNLRTKVRERFDIAAVMEKYDEINTVLMC